MTAAIIGIVGVLVGTLTGAIMTGTIEHRNETRRWVRGARTQAYGAFIDELQTLRMHTRKLVFDDWAGAERHPLDDVHVDLWTPYNSAFVSVEMYGTAEVFGRALKADEALRRLSLRARRREIGPDTWTEARQDTDRAMRETIDQIRVELRLPKQVTRDAWVRQNLTATDE